MVEREGAGADTHEVGSQRMGWDIVAGVLTLHVIVVAKIATLGPRRPAVTGDPMSLWVGLGFVLWGTACLIAQRAGHMSVLFRVLNRRHAAGILGWMFLITAAYLLGRYVGIL